MSLLAEMRGSGNGAARQFGQAWLGWAGLVGPCSLVMRHNWAKPRLALRLISSYVCFFVCLLLGLVSSKEDLCPCWRKWEAPDMALRGNLGGWAWVGLASRALQPCNVTQLGQTQIGVASDQ